MLGPNKVFDTEKYFVLCANVLGSCYGSSGPQSIDPDTGKVYGNKFPQVGALFNLIWTIYFDENVLNGFVVSFNRSLSETL